MSADFIPKEIRDKLKFTYQKGEEAAYPVTVDFVPQLVKCPDCDRMVQDRRTWLRFYEKPYKHWHELCKGCSLVKNPENGVFEIKHCDTNRFIKARPDLFKK